MKNLIEKALFNNDGEIAIKKTIDKLIMKYNRQNIGQFLDKDLQIDLNKKNTFNIAGKIIKPTERGIMVQMNDFKIFINYEDIKNIKIHETNLIKN